MPSAVKVAISLPQPLLESIERERRDRRQSRSEFIRQAVQRYLKGLEERRAIERYVEGYREQPETSEEVGAVSSAALAALSGETWD